MSTLSHFDLIEISRLLGLNSPNGVCKGFSMAWAFSVIDKTEESFKQRLIFLEKYNRNFTALIHDIERAKDKVKGKLPLTADDELALSIPALFDLMEIYLTPWFYEELINKLVGQNDVKTLYTISNDLDKEIEVYNLPNIFNLQEMEIFFSELGKVLKKDFDKTQNPIPIVLTSTTHAISLKLIPKNNNDFEWEFVNTNDFSREPSYSRILNTEQLVKAVYNAFGALNCEKSLVAMETTIITENPSSYIKETLTQRAENFLVTKEKANQYDDNGAGLIHLAAQFGHSELIDELIDANTELNKATLNPIQTPLTIACSFGERETIKKLLSLRVKPQKIVEQIVSTNVLADYSFRIFLKKELLHKGFLLNQLDEQGLNCFHQAIKHKNLSIIPYLCFYKEIDINFPAAVCNNLTPLMALILTPESANNMDIFETLLANGADLTLKERFQLTALDIAVRVNHSAAIEAILNHVIELELPITEVMSPETQLSVEKNPLVQTNSYYQNYFKAPAPPSVTAFSLFKHKLKETVSPEEKATFGASK